MMDYNSLDNYYNTMFSMIQHHKYNPSEIESMIPFERDLYVQMLINHLKSLEESKKRN
jgi:hypothetical protein